MSPKKEIIRSPTLAAKVAAGRRMRQRTEDPIPSWTDLPPEITVEILHRIGVVKIMETTRLCSSWFHQSKDPSMWRVIDMRFDGEMPPHGIDRMCRKAVDRSRGQAVEIYLRSFPTDDDLDYIAQRAGNLKKLQLEKCFLLSGKGLIEAIKRFPCLEELHIILSNFTGDTIEVVGQSCPLLSSFTFNGKATRFAELDSDGEFTGYITDIPRLRNEEAFAIASSMPGLRRLQVVVNGMTNEGLVAILDSCPHLESLDLRRCFHLDLTGDLNQRLSAQIRCLRYPYDSIDDYEFEVDDEYDSYSTPYSGPTWSECPENDFYHHYPHLLLE